ncbi:GNAT family N-acetyltransferase [Rhodoplanes sp. Z2-YC6860]|uniref:GNAT family N-acetyltransferase n=1 Tax=Rhodoplanes sp. Z2-YC6860 TaxID=674703 RepID=UPI00078C1673|nr:GNAT family protein [Rhodoplanes sp. Z2-YC6860]AMN45207.1 N-acetyltransferase GCN5 [Rhodoplanes sp. Z2-YC6860]
MVVNEGLPVGEAVDATPAPMPGAVTLKGRYGSVERLDAAKHSPSLWAAMAGHDPIWTYIFVTSPSDEAAFRSTIAEYERHRERIFYAVVDDKGAALGILSLMEIRPAMRVIEVGNIVYAPALQRTPLGTEAQYLIARYAIETLGYRRYEWKCDSLNAPSRRAAARYGFTYEGTFRQHMIVKGRNRDTAWFSILDSEWPARRAAFERWLTPENFDSNGRQKAKLGEA